MLECVRDNGPNAKVTKLNKKLIEDVECDQARSRGQCAIENADLCCCIGIGGGADVLLLSEFVLELGKVIGS